AHRRQIWRHFLPRHAAAVDKPFSIHRTLARGLATGSQMWFRPVVGDEVSASRFSREERQRYREKVQLCLDVFERMLTSTDVSFDSENPLTGLEMELNLVGRDD